MESYLQTIIGTDKRNPVFTILKNSKEKTVIVYFGGCLLEVVRDRPDNYDLKHLIARLFNSGVNKKSLTDNFGYSFKSMQRWANALKTGNPETIVAAFSGQGAQKKLTTEIRAYVARRFRAIYPKNQYSYSAEIREEILEVFNKTMAAETLRPLFNELKEKHFKKKK